MSLNIEASMQSDVNMSTSKVAASMGSTVVNAVWEEERGSRSQL